MFDLSALIDNDKYGKDVVELQKKSEKNASSSLRIQLLHAGHWRSASHQSL
jgi:hypothetical protein